MKRGDRKINDINETTVVKQTVRVEQNVKENSKVIMTLTLKENVECSVAH